MSMTQEKAKEILSDWDLCHYTPSKETAEVIISAIDPLEIISALRGPTREMVERVWFKEPYTRLGAWNRDDGATVYSAKNTCMSCGCETPIGNFCHNCGAALDLTGVSLVMERLRGVMGP